jgi:large subunit ribosomal protein L11e
LDILGTLGIYGMDFYVCMGRPGYRVARRKHAGGRVGHPHRVTKDETIAWFKKKFDGGLFLVDLD